MVHAPLIMFSVLRIPLPIAAVTVCAVISPLVEAQVYKCAGEGGTPIYQEMPCETGKELRNFQTDPPLITILPSQRLTSPPAASVKETPAKESGPAKDAKPGKAASSGDASERRLIRIGMSEAEVRAKLGQPDMTAGGKANAPTRWTYMPAAGDPETITTLIFASGKVTDIERKVVRK